MTQDELAITDEEVDPEYGTPAEQHAAVGPETLCVATAAKRADPDGRVLGRLLKMADDYRASHSLQQAIEMYFKLVEGYAETLQAQVAREQLLEIAEKYEHNGKLHHARGIYERLL